MSQNGSAMEDFKIGMLFILQVVPSILGMLISFVSSDEEMWKGYFYAALLVGVNLVNTLLNSQYFYKLGLVGLRMRSALTSALYRKTLLLGPASRKYLSGTLFV